MNYSKQIYWLTRLDGIHRLFDTMMIIAIFGLVILIVIKAINYLDCEEGTKRPWLVGTLIFFLSISTLGKTFLPTTKEAIFIVAGGRTLDYVSTDTSINKIPGKLADITTTWLDQKLNEMKTEVKSKSEK
jgi:hypothetical protein